MRSTLLITLVVLAGTLGISVAVWSADQSTEKLTLEVRDASPADVAAKLSTASGVYVLADPDVTGKITCGLVDVSLVDALRAVCKDTKLAWYTVDMNIPKDKVPDVAEVAKYVRLLSLLETDTFIARSANGKMIARADRIEPKTEKPLKDGKPTGLTTVYLISAADLKAPKEVKSNVDKMMDMQRDSMAMMASLTPEETTEMMRRGLEMYMNMDPAQKAALINSQLEAMTKMDPQVMHNVMTETQDIAQQIPQETLDKLMKVWGWDPNAETPEPPR